MASDGFSFEPNRVFAVWTRFYGAVVERGGVSTMSRGYTPGTYRATTSSLHTGSVHRCYRMHLPYKLVPANTNDVPQHSEYSRERWSLRFRGRSSCWTRMWRIYLGAKYIRRLNWQLAEDQHCWQLGHGIHHDQAAGDERLS